MKFCVRFAALLLVMALLCTGLPLGVLADTVYGDVNGDKTINATDALMVLKYAVHKQEFTDQQKVIAEVSADQTINAADALLILKYAVGKINRFPIEDVAGVTLGGTYTAITGLSNASGYKTPVAPVAIDEPFNTLTQINVSYDKTYDLDVQCYLGYVYGMNASDSYGGLPEAWKIKKTTYHNDTTFGMMIAINRDNGEYLNTYAGDRGTKDIQTKKNGEYRLHSVMGESKIYYMVPTTPYIEYKWQVIDSYLRCGSIDVVALEEPEMFNNAGYSEGFKEEYEAYYGEAWVDPDTSAEAMWKSQYFKAYIFKHAFEVISGRIKEKYPDVTVLITSHSNLSYNKHGISTGLYMYSSIDTIDGVIGQTWSDDAAMTYPYAGEKVSNVFMSALYSYNSYGEALQSGQTLYLLQDPASDLAGTLEEELMFNRWKETVVAAMMQNDTTSFQSTIWPQRAFGIASDEYKLMQLNINKMYEEFGTLSGANYAGTPGIAVGISDSAGWHLGKDNVLTGNYQATIGGIFAALQNDGIPVDTVYLDHEKLEDQLKQTNLLILAYDTIKPMNENANKVIADWVKEGGRILYVGGHDAFSDFSLEWWGKQQTSPFKDLIRQLGLSDMTTTVGGMRANTIPVWADSSFDDTCALTQQYTDQTISFGGTGFDSFMTLDGKNIGVSAKIGKGKAIMVGLPSAYYSLCPASESVICELTALALQGSDTEYQSGAGFVSARGNYFGYYSPTKENKTASDRTFIDLFHPQLKVIPGGTVLPKQQACLYYDVTEAANASIPKIGFIGATEMEKRVEKENKTQYVIANPSSSQAVSILFGNGKYPQSVVAMQRSSKRSVTAIWDETTDSLTIQVPNRDVAKDIVVTVTWGDQLGEEFIK